MIAEVISIGDELTSGQRLDTNSRWLSQQLADLGIVTNYHTTVGDDLAANVDVFQIAVRRADVVISTGGLGPTADDLTRQAVAEASGADLQLDQAALDHIESMFARRGREMPPRNTVQAMFPCGSRPIANPNGTAPGIDMRVDHGGGRSSRLFALPGVPAEMFEMWAGTVEPALREMLGESIRMIRHRRIKCFGVGESDLERMLPDLIARDRLPRVGITVHKATITLRVTADGRTEQECFAAMEPTLSTIRQCLGDLVYGEEDDQLQHAVLRKLAERGQTLSTIECGSGGRIGNWLSEADPDGSLYRGGMVVRRPLSSVFDTANSENPAERNWVGRMAAQCRDRFETDFALAVGAYPCETSDDPRVTHAVASASGVSEYTTRYTGHPDLLKSRTAKLSLNFLRKILQTQA